MAPSIVVQVTVVMVMLVIGGVLIGVSAMAMWFNRSTKSLRPMRLGDYGRRSLEKRRRR